MRVLPTTGSFWDIGAYVGTYALLARHLNPTVSVVAVEPDPMNLHRLERNLGLNGIDGVEVEALAIGRSSGRASMDSSGGRAMSFKLAESTAGDTVVSTLDSLLASRRRPELIMMDIEGGEADALHGAETILNDIRPNWLIELHGAQGLTAYNTLLDTGYEVKPLIPIGSVEFALRTQRVHVFARPSELSGA